MHKFLTTLLLLFTVVMHSQIKGNIKAPGGEGIPFVSITIENTYTGTTASESGYYELNLKKPGEYTIIFQSIGFKTKKVPVNITSFPHTLDVELADESYELKELVISNAEDPAYEIIRQAVAHKKENSAKTGRFEADFYSKGIFRVKDLPKKILGQEVEVPEGMVDSTGAGIIYLSETVSHITFEQPDKLKERIVASKVSGRDNGFSFNTALGTYYNFYDNYVEFSDMRMISPLANNSTNYYRFKLEGTFFDDNNNLINKIKLIPRRDKEPVFEGYIYIVDGSWAIYAIDFDIKGYRMQQPFLETLNLQQNFTYNTSNGIWAKNSQTFDFKAGAFGIKFTANFTHVYTNYVFHDSFEKKTFSKEVVYIEEEANKKDDSYWNTMRPVPLTEEETTDYHKKDSIQELKKSKPYLDSIDRKHNRFRIGSIITGYDYRNSEKKYGFNYDGIIRLPGYNTVQGWNFNTTVSFYKRDEDKRTYWSAGARFNYGIAEDRLRVNGWLSRKFAKDAGVLSLLGGNTIEQFNPDQPISELINSVSTLFFKDNYMKLYDKTFARLQYTKDITTGFTGYASAEYLRRRGLLNNADWVLIKNDHDYTSNNPLEPGNYTSLPFDTHTLYKASIGGSVRFGMKYITRPDGKIPVRGGNYPTLSFRYDKAFAGSDKQYKYDFIALRTTYNASIGNKGDFGINLKAGKFFNADGIAFADYKHFNGNQTRVGTEETYLNRFNLLPYYTHSTNDQYFEAHVEHNFKGYIMNKIPGLNLLQWNLIVGYHNIATPNYKPYHEFNVGFDNIGIGNFRFLRLDYVRSYQSGFVTDGVVFGLKFLDFLD